MKINALLVVSIIWIFYSCQKEELSLDDVYCLPTITINELDSRADGEMFLPDGAQVGISVTGDGSLIYNGKNNLNVQYTAVGTGDAQSWVSDNPILLSDEVGIAYAYYPFQKAVDCSSFTMNLTIDNPYALYGTNNNISAASPEFNLELNHLTCGIRINIDKEDYKGEGKLIYLKINSGLYSSINFNLYEAKINSYSGNVIYNGNNDFLDDDGLVVELFGFPAKGEGEFEFEIQLDERIYIYKTKKVKFEKGNIYVYNLNI